MLDQDTLHFLNRLWITLHRMCRAHNLFRCDAVDMCARIFYYSVSSICRRAIAEKEVILSVESTLVVSE